MKKTLVVLVITTLGLTSLALAAPRTLSSGEMDAVSAGQQTDSSALLGDLLGLITLPSATPSQTTNLEPSAVSAEDNGSIAVAGFGSQQLVAGALATDNGLAVSGTGNIAIALDGNLAAFDAAAGQCNQVAYQYESDIAQLATDDACLSALNIEFVTVDYGSALVIGDDNETCVATDNTCVFGIIEEDGVGVIAQEAKVCESFNIVITDVVVCVDIEDSFNNTANKQDVSGQNNVSAIVSANTLGNAAAGTNLNLSTADAKTSTRESGTGSMLSVPFISGNAIAATIQNQAVLNYVAAGCGDITF